MAILSEELAAKLTQNYINVNLMTYLYIASRDMPKRAFISPSKW